MSDDFAKLLVDAYNRPDPNPYLFQIGQTVRLKLGLSDDGQTPRCWDGAKCEVVKRRCSGLYKEHWYILRHLELNATEEFREYEIDRRYSRLD